MHRPRSIVTCLVLAIAQISRADYFINPAAAGEDAVFTNNPTYELGSVVELQWETSLTGYGVNLLQQKLDVRGASISDDGVIYSKASNQVEVGAYNWTVSTLDFDRDKSNVYYFFLYASNGSTYGGILSHYFNISVPSTTTTTSGATTSTPAPTSTGNAAGIVTNGAIGPSSSPTPETQSTSSSSDLGMKLGLGLGLGLGIPAIAAAAFLAWRRRNNKMKPDTSSTPVAPAPPYKYHQAELDDPSSTPAGTNEVKYNYAQPPAQYYNPPPQEMPVNHEAAAEMPGDTRYRT